IFLTSLTSRALRSWELRIDQIVLDQTATDFIDNASKNSGGVVRLLAHRPGNTDYAKKEEESRQGHNLKDDSFIFLEVALGDASDFHADCLTVSGQVVGGYQVLRCTSPAIPNAIAALL